MVVVAIVKVPDVFEIHCISPIWDKSKVVGSKKKAHRRRVRLSIAAAETGSSTALSQSES
jgi:hypothetical protein